MVKIEASSVKKSTTTVGASEKKTIIAKTATHPTTASMVRKALMSLNDKNGSTTQALKKFIAENFEVDMQRQTPFLKRYLRKAVEKGELVQTKGTGAVGSFKIGDKGAAVSKKKVKSVEQNKTKVVNKKTTPVKKETEKKTVVVKDVPIPLPSATVNKTKKVSSVAEKKSKIAAVKTKTPKVKTLVKTAIPTPAQVKGKSAAKKTAPKRK